MKPNIILIMTDQQRFDSLSCYGEKAISTPNLDSLWNTGVKFNNCYVNNPICTPSRASIMTGVPLEGHGVYKLNDVLPGDKMLFTKKLQEKGYSTSLVGKLHVSAATMEKNRRHINDGFDTYKWCHEPSLFLDGKYNAYGQWLKDEQPEFYVKLLKEGRRVLNIPYEFHFTKWACDEVINIIKEDHNKPFFINLSLFDPHNPYNQYPKELEEYVDESKIQSPVYKEGESMEKPHGIYREYKHGYLGCMSNKTPEELMSIKKGYLCAVKMIDIEVGRVIEALKKKDIFNNTVIIFVSDHGDMLGDHELMAKGAFFYDACTKVPLIMSYPAKFSNGIECDSLVQPSDIASTLLEAAGCKIEEINSLMPHSINLIKSTHNSIRDVCICSYKNTGISDDKTYHNPPINATMLRDKDFKLNVYHGELKGELYDMHNDKNEINNLWDIPEYSEVKLRLLNKLLDTVIDYDIAYNSGKGGSGESVASNLL